MKFQITLVLVGLACSALAAPAKVEPQILKNLQEAPTTNVLVTFNKADTKDALARFDTLALASRTAKLNTLYNVLKDHTDSIQADVVSMLEKTQAAKKHDLRPLWMSAELIIRGVDQETVEQLRNHPDVESLVAEKFIEIAPVERRELAPFEISPNAQWGVDAVHAEQAHALGFRGQGIVVANTDTGVNYAHDALRSNFRGTVQGNNDYAWYAPTGKGATPNDGNGHGTHTMGTIAGTANGIGVAPGATWVACKGCATSSCSSFDLTECGNWMGCPTKTDGSAPDCSKAPNLVSNSWGGGQADTWYDAIMQAWRRVNIVPLFSAGNSGPSCSSANSPGDSIYAISVGSTTSGNILSSFSSVGPTRQSPARRFPTCSAPGSNVVSASHNNNSGYATMSGTSMACPHAAGITAILLSKNPNLTVDQVEAELIRGAQRIASSNANCGGIADSTYPNNHAGHGRLDALASVQ